MLHFLKYISHYVHYGSVIEVDNLKCPAIEHEILKVIRCYSVRGFNAVLILVDIQFNILKERDHVGAKCNVFSKEERAPTIERSHRVIEERWRCYCAMLPFKNSQDKWWCNF